MGLIPCAMIEPYVELVKCYLRKGSDISKPAVLVYDFGDIVANTKISLWIDNITNPDPGSVYAA